MTSNASDKNNRATFSSRHNKNIKSNDFIDEIIQVKNNRCIRELKSFFERNLDLLEEKGSSKTNIVDQYGCKAYHINGPRLDDFFDLGPKTHDAQVTPMFFENCFGIRLGQFSEVESNEGFLENL